jgi:hypothetical protein
MKPKTEILLMLLASVLASIVLRFYFSGERRFEEAALGELSVVYQSVDQTGRIIHTINQTPEEIAQMAEVAKSGKPNILILGNSQTHAINQKREGEVNYPELLSRMRPGQNILTNSLPNGNLQEMLAIAAWWMEKAEFRQVLVPVFMDDLREDGLRPKFLRAVVEDGFLFKETGPVQSKLNADLELLRKPMETAVQGGKKEERPTPQDLVEGLLNEKLDARSEIWRNRPNARGDMFMTLYQWRNTLFGITASTKRKMIPTRYRQNMDALDALLKTCRSRGVGVLVYIPPIRTDVEVPYDLKEYSDFKSQVKKAAADNGAAFADLESLVPGALWGMKASTTSGGKPELDYMHFQGEGHRLLAQALEPLILDKP